MDFGVHLPLFWIDEAPVPVERTLEYAAYVERLGFRSLAAHDHVAHRRPWLDAPTILAAAVAHTSRVELITAVWLPIVRGPVVLARAYIALDLLSGGRVIAGIGAGSSALDFAGAGVPFEERWPRFDESVGALRALFRPEAEPFTGRYYTTEGITLRPGPARPGGPPLWMGTWGSEAGLRRTARLGDGWIASAYNTTPESFATAWWRLRELLPRQGKDPDQFPNALASMALYVTDDPAAANHVLGDILGPTLHRDPEALRRALPVGSPEACARTLRAYCEAGAQQILLMPVIDGFRQLDLFVERVLPLVNAP